MPSTKSSIAGRARPSGDQTWIRQRSSWPHSTYGRLPSRLNALLYLFVCLSKEIVPTPMPGVLLELAHAHSVFDPEKTNKSEHPHLLPECDSWEIPLHDSTPKPEQYWDIIVLQEIEEGIQELCITSSMKRVNHMNPDCVTHTIQELPICPHSRQLVCKKLNLNPTDTVYMSVVPYTRSQDITCFLYMMYGAYTSQPSINSEELANAQDRAIHISELAPQNFLQRVRSASERYPKEARKREISPFVKWMDTYCPLLLRPFIKPYFFAYVTGRLQSRTPEEKACLSHWQKEVKAFWETPHTFIDPTTKIYRVPHPIKTAQYPTKADQLRHRIQEYITKKNR